MTRRMLRSLVLLPCLLALPACGDDPTGMGAGDSWVLATADGVALPAVIDSLRIGDAMRLSRIIRGGVELISRDSAVYLRQTQVLWRQDDGTVIEVAASCHARPVEYWRSGDLLVLHADSVVFPPSHGHGYIAALNDTLRISGSSLLQPLHITDGQPRTVTLSYRPGALQPPRC
jgi:hypothetical protein